MDPNTGALYREDELKDLLPEIQKRVVPVPTRLKASAAALLDWRDQLRAEEANRKKKERKRRKMARDSKRRNR